MRTQVRLNLYEHGIVNSLIQEHDVAPVAARQLVAQYIDVIRKLGGYDSVGEHADRLVRARETGYSPEAWMERIREVEREEVRDKMFLSHEGGPEYLHV